MRVQSVLFHSAGIEQATELYYRYDKSVRRIDFNTYFNAFYIEKHKKYTKIKGLELVFNKVPAWVSKIILMHDDEVVGEKAITGIEALRFANAVDDENAVLRMSFPYDEYDSGVFWFSIETDSSSISEQRLEEEIKAYYEGTIDDSELRPVRVAVNICTFRREPYVCRNMRELTNWFKTPAGRQIAEHLEVYIIDNGQTLSSEHVTQEGTGAAIGELLTIVDSHDNIRIFPNSNTGGCGGFTRGMELALSEQESKEITHVLMMDDDAVFDPDLFTRLVSLLSTLKSDHQRMAVGGALLREDYPYMQHACGEWFDNFKVENKHIIADLRDVDVVTADWMLESGKETSVYGAWWCCCYPISEITKQTLPLQIFVHQDDIQFGLHRAANGTIFMNGIGVWHQGFELAFQGVKQYYDVRNTLITAALFDQKLTKWKMKRWAWRRMIGMVLQYRYADVDFVYMGFMDFLRGKAWLEGLDQEENHKKLSAYYKEVFPLTPVLASSDADKISEQAGGFTDEERERLAAEVRKFSNKLTPDQLRDFYFALNRINGHRDKEISLNGWLLPSTSEPVLVTPLSITWDSFRHKRVLMYEPASGKGCEMHRKWSRLLGMAGQMIKMGVTLDVRFHKVCGEYRSIDSL